MSRLGWNCPQCNRTYVVPDLVCEPCGTVAGQLREFLSTVERMCMMQRHFGGTWLSPEAHRPTHQQVAASTSCPDCEGDGALPPVLLEPGAPCMRCNGSGYVWRSQLTPEELAADDVKRARGRTMREQSESGAGHQRAAVPR